MYPVARGDIYHEIDPLHSIEYIMSETWLFCFANYSMTTKKIEEKRKKKTKAKP